MCRDRSLHRAWQKKIFVLLILAGLSLAMLGIYTLHISPTLFFDDSTFPSARSELDIRKIDRLELDPSVFGKLPEFFFPKEEADWWGMQESLCSLLEEKSFVEVEFVGKAAVPRRVEAAIGFVSLSEAIKRTGLVYLVGLIYLISAVSVFQRHCSPPGSLLAFFLVFGTLYFISATPVMTRPVTLYPPYFKLLIKSTYLSAGGLITLVHFAFVFPKPKGVLRRFPAIPCLFASINT